ncbi:MAG: 50S ribosomal protein L18 [Patescibacteria group bacterium]|nr:50S ribosomal protein L18 [Patescibacteria group bacterium]MDW8279568.1 50S ribosomal protein L18 [bacterium]
MDRKEINKIRKLKIRRVRAKISGTPERPRLAVKRSNKNIYVQLIDDTVGKTLVSASSLELKDIKLNKTEMAKNVGKLIAEKALKQGIREVVFDRRWYKYHGRVKSLADAAREAGLKF